MNEQKLRDIFSVSQLNQAVKRVLEETFGVVWVQGEISNLARPASGHIYFSLKDPKAQVRCAMFRAKNALINFAVDNGAEVIARARVGMYEARGEYQLIIEHLEPAGDGLLRLKFEELKRKLAAEGLFDEDNKFEIPAHPNQIGVITSTSGAALRDILTTLKRRNPAIPIIVYPTAVQGSEAKREIVAAIDKANRRDECDVLILARGGGSLEDLWSFNEESVVRAIHASEIPIITGIGHEIDFTLADFAADLRAATPTAAAEICAPPLDALQENIRSLIITLRREIERRLHNDERELQLQKSRLQHPGKRIEQLFQSCDELSVRLPRAIQNVLTLNLSRVANFSTTLRARSPMTKITALQQLTTQQVKDLSFGTAQKLADQKALVNELQRTLIAVSPNATLSRGYSILTDENQAIVRQAGKQTVGHQLTARLAEGSLKLTVKEVAAGIGDPNYEITNNE